MDQPARSLVGRVPVSLPHILGRVLFASAPYFLARGLVTEVGAELSNPLPADGVFSRVMPNKYAVQFANGVGKIAGGDEVFVGGATDMEGFDAAGAITAGFVLRQAKEPRPSSAPTILSCIP